MEKCKACGLLVVDPADPARYDVLNRDFDPGDPLEQVGPYCLYDWPNTITGKLDFPYTEEEQARADAIGVLIASADEQEALVRAVQVNAAPEELTALQESIFSAEGIEQGDPWRQPTGAHDAYPLGAIVTHNDKTWESTVAANVWEPGVSGWKESGPGIPDWVQPSGSHDAYGLGDIVRHNDKVWISDVADNVWEPGVFGWTETEEP